MEQSSAQPEAREASGGNWKELGVGAKVEYVCACLRLEEAGAELRHRDWSWITPFTSSSWASGEWYNWGSCRRGSPTPVSEGCCCVGLIKHEFWSLSTGVEILALLPAWTGHLNLSVSSDVSSSVE